MENSNFDDIKKLFADTSARFAETDRRIAETDARMDKRSAEADERMERGFAELRASFEDTDERMDKQIAETDARLDKRFAELRKIVNELSRNIGWESNRMRAEDFFFSSLAEKKQLGGILFDAVDKNVRFSKKGVHGEFDTVMINGDSVALIEIKYKANAEHLQNLITEKPESFRRLFPEYKNYKFYLGLAGMSFEDENVKRMALQAGVAILEAHGDHAEIIAPNLKVY